jgi:hypothetical protein
MYQEKLIDARTVVGTPAFLPSEIVETVRSIFQAKVPAGRRQGKPKVTLVIERMVKHDDFGVAHETLDEVEAQVNRFIAEARKVWTVKVVRYTPNAWKAQVPKSVMASRIAVVLSPQEVAAYKDEGHDAVDAVGIALFHTLRLGRGGVA